MNWLHKDAEIFRDALALTRERTGFAERLIESHDFEESGEVSPQWREEIIRRCKEIDDGLTELIPAEVVLSRAYSALK